LYIGQVAKMMMDQYAAYRVSAALIPPLQQAYALLERLEAFEVEVLTEPLEEFAQEYQEEIWAEQQAAEEIAFARSTQLQPSLRDVVPVSPPEFAPAF